MLFIMLSIPKVITYVNDKNIGLYTLQQYFEKSSEGLKNLNKRSIRITQFILILVVFHLFRKYFTHIKIKEIEFDVQIFRLINPTLISYLLFEWLMMAKRRRDLIFGIQQATHRLFKISPPYTEAFFPGFNPNVLNVMPYSFMCEVLSIDDKSGFNRHIYIFAIKFLFVILVIIMGTSFIEYWDAYGFTLCFKWPSTWQTFIETISFYGSLLITLLFTGWIVYYYRTEFSNKNEIINTNK